jgi:transcription initiation factor TFIIE subunit alpha
VIKLRITNKLIKETVIEVVGEQAIPIIDYLKDKKNISEFIIAEDLKYEIHLVRQLLYKLHDNNLVIYNRKKDRQKGWYISYWTFNSSKIKELIKRMKTNKLDRLNDRLEKEENNKNCFFMCSNACTRLDFEYATNFEFKCPECGSLLNQQENDKTIKYIKEQINILEKELKVMG